MGNVSPRRSDVNRPTIVAERIEPVVRYFWPRRYEMTRRDLDTIDGTFLAECCRLPDAARSFWDEHLGPDDDDEDLKTRDVVAWPRTGWSSPTVVHYVQDSDTVQPEQLPEAPPSRVSEATGIVLDRSWDGEVVESRIQALWGLGRDYGRNITRSGYRDHITRLPTDMVIPPTMRLVAVKSIADDLREIPRADQTVPQRWGISISLKVHDTEDGLPPGHLLAETYDIVTAATGWREMLDGPVLNQEPQQAIRGWSVALQMLTGMSENAARQWFEEQFPEADSHSHDSFVDARNNIIERVPEARFLVRPKRQSGTSGRSNRPPHAK